MGVVAADADHHDLARLLQMCSATVLLSGYHSPLYDELYADWHRTERRVLRRASNGRTRAQTHVAEVIWSNRPLPESLHLEGITG